MAKTHERPAVTAHRIPPALEPNAWTRRLGERRVAGADLLDLTEMNPTRLGLADGAAAARCLQRALDDPRAASYEPDPRGMRSAREAVAGYYAARGTPVEADRIVLTTGTSESYAHLFCLLADTGDTVLVPAPSYPLFEPIASVAGLRVASYRLAYDGAWHLDVDSLEAAFRGAASPVRAVVVVQPNHPTGSWLEAAEVLALEEQCASYGAALIADEVFIEYSWPDQPPAPSLLAERQGSTFVLGGLSKCCGLPQLKLGWIAVAGPAAETRRLLDGLEWIADLFLSLATPVQLALPELLDLRHDFQLRVRKRLAENLATLQSLGGEQRSEAALLNGRAGWAAILSLPSRRTDEEWALALLDRDVIVHPGHFYDLERSAAVVSLLVEPAQLRAARERLRELLAAS